MLFPCSWQNYSVFTLYSVTDIHLVHEAVFDPQILVEVSGVDRIGSLTSSKVWEIDIPGRITPGSFSPGGAETLGKVLRDSIERRILLWVSLIEPEKLADLHKCLGKNVFVTAGPGTPVPADMRLRHPGTKMLIPVAVSPVTLLRRLLSGTEAEKEWVRFHLEGIDSKAVSTACYAMLREAKVEVLERSRAFRLMHSPTFVAYAVILIYSLLRALPVLWVPNFRGNVWVLWGIDVVSAIPYTWGILEFVVGKTRLRRFVGMIVTLVTFISPYIYFWSHGDHYPFFVNLVVAGMITAAILLELYRAIRDRQVSRVLRRPAGV